MNSRIDRNQFKSNSSRFGDWALIILGLAITLIMVACGGGSRGTGTYGLDTMRPGKITEEMERAPFDTKDRNTSEGNITTPTPTPAVVVN